MKKILFVIAFLLFSCKNSSLPSRASDMAAGAAGSINDMIPPPSNTPPTTPPPPVRVDEPFQWETFAGFTAFALGKPGQTEEDIRGLYADAMANGFNTGRICSENEFWDGSESYLPTKPRDAERLDWLLETIATIPGAQVLLIGDCTLKRQVPLDEALQWARDVARIASKYSNVAVETTNEFDNCRGRESWGGSAAYCPGKLAVREHIKVYRRAGIEFVTADDRLCAPDFPDQIDFRLANIGAWPSDFHACRTINERGEHPDGHPGEVVEPWDPGRRQIRQLYERNGMVLFSETVALGDVTGSGTGLRTQDHDRIQTFINECDLVDEENGDLGCKFVFHSEALLGGEKPGWWPNSKKR
jgi:hypothetical protein